MMLYKGKGDIGNCDNYRGISLLTHMMKVFTKLISQKLLKVVRLPDEQFGFRKGKSTMDAINILRQRVKEALSSPRTPLYAVLIDFKKAFDQVPRQKLLEKLTKFHGIPPDSRLHMIIKDLLKQNFIQIDDGLRKTGLIRQKDGVLQGDSLSPLLFIAFVADLPDELSDAGVEPIMYCLLYTSPSPRDA